MSEPALSPARAVPSRSRSALRVAPLLFFSGACALVYQVAWQREFRLVFGASTAASAAVIAIFIAGLGGGGLWFGRRADKHARPLMMYAHLELGVAVLAALSPLLLKLVRALYVAMGGSFVLGGAGATAVRLLLATLVLLGPTFLMGGTLPAAARAVERDADAGRSDVALLYGVNTLGAVSGAAFATFVALEVFGTQLTLFLACLVNALVAKIGRVVSRSLPDAAREPAASSESSPSAAPIPPLVRGFALAASLLVGFAFFLMEIVWYRMLGPLLGGTVFTFGLVLAVALFGIGVGGALYGMIGEKRRATLAGFAVTCLVEAICLFVPFALGDSLALLALRLQPLGAFGFSGFLSSWALVAIIVIVPGAIAAGYQFPLLIALIGRGRDQVGEQIGRVYAFNTVGAILGAVAGGFGLLPLVSATGAWRLVVVVLVILGAAAAALAFREGAKLRAIVLPAALLLASLPLLRSRGPSAVWRHSSIGAQRVELSSVSNPNRQREWINSLGRYIPWAKDGVESSVAFDVRNGIAFIVNGKNDGNSRSDAATQVMCGLMSAMFHPAPKKGLVIGLGTGSTGGWLASVPEIERVDVIEMEPLVREMARRSAAVNRNALENPKMRILIGDGREAMLTLPDRYDIIGSEPSNPYRAGIASLYTREFYESAKKRLTDSGIFAQWLQAYEVDAQTIRTVIATIASVFPYVDVWELKSSDILLQASNKPIVYDVERLRKRVAEEPFKTALRAAWRTTTVEGVLAHHVARASLTKNIRELEGDRLNTDDATLIEFGFARALGRSLDLAMDLRRLARSRGEHLPELVGTVDLAALDDERAAFLTLSQEDPLLPNDASKGHTIRQKARKAALDRAFAPAMHEWRQQTAEPTTYADIALMAESAAETNSDEAPAFLAKLAAIAPNEALCVEARYLWFNKKPEDAAPKLAEFLEVMRGDPWPDLTLASRCFQLSELVAKRSPELTTKFFDIAIKGPFAVSLHEESRQQLLTALAPDPPRCVAAHGVTEPFPPWDLGTLQARARCYQLANSPLAAKAEAEYRMFLQNEPMPLEEGLEKKLEKK